MVRKTGGSDNERPPGLRILESFCFQPNDIRMSHLIALDLPCIHGVLPQTKTLNHISGTRNQKGLRRTRPHSETFDLVRPSFSKRFQRVNLPKLRLSQIFNATCFLLVRVRGKLQSFEKRAPPHVPQTARSCAVHPVFSNWPGTLISRIGRPCISMGADAVKTAPRPASLLLVLVGPQMQRRGSLVRRCLYGQALWSTTVPFCSQAARQGSRVLRVPEARRS
jgi:hypothetical protein